MRYLTFLLATLTLAGCDSPRTEPDCTAWSRGEIELSDDQVSCESDDDCTIASLSCGCDCRSGGTPIAVNVQSAETVQAPSACCSDGPRNCLQVDNCSEPARCRVGRCTLPQDLPDDVPDAGPPADMKRFPDTDLADMAEPAGTRFDQVMFAATHNSYSGEGRGSILAQLEVGVRFIEFDVHTDDFATSGYRIGHDDPGHEVELGGENPDNDAFTAWLAVVQGWRDDNPNHLPLTIGIDLKDDLFATATTGEGNLARLNQLIVDTFGDALFTEADAVAGWPDVEEMRGRVLVVLSGNTNSRLGYRRVEGSEPTVAVTQDATLVAYQDGNDLILWSGDPREFWRYERFDGLTDPTVDVEGTDVVLIAVEPPTLMQIRTGSLNDDHSITWDRDFTTLGPGTAPAARFVDPTTIRVVTDTGTWEVDWDSASRVAAWSTAPAAARPDEAVDGEVSVAATETPPYGAVVHLTDAAGPRRVRLAQRMFSESQIGGPPEFEEDGVMFYAADAFGLQDVVWAEEKRTAGHIVRLWKFNLPNVSPDPPPTFPATDRPVSDWYEEYCEPCLRD